MPDLAGKGTLAYRLAWHDQCFRYEASGSGRVEVVPSSTFGDCALVDNDTYNAEIRELFAPPLRVGSRETDLFTPSNRSNYGPFENPGIDWDLVYAFHPDEPAILAAPGTAFRVVNPNGDLGLSNFELWVWTRKSVAMSASDYPPVPVVQVLHRTPDLQADGTWRLRVPTEPGRYVAGLRFAFESSCATGEAEAMLNIDVVAPG